MKKYTTRHICFAQNTFSLIPRNLKRCIRCCKKFMSRYTKKILLVPIVVFHFINASNNTNTHTRILSRPWNHLFRLPLSRASSPSLEINSIELFLSWHLRLRLVPWYDTCAYFPNITVPQPMAVDSCIL